MPDHDAAPDPMDKAYVEAEAILDDETARAARRARVLGAVAREAQETPPAAPAPSTQRQGWRRGGWLAAASVAGLSTLIAVRLYPPAEVRHAPSPAQPPVPAAAAPAPATATAPAADLPAQPSLSTSTPPTIASRAETREERDMAKADTAPPPAPVLQPAPGPAPAPPPAAPPAPNEIVVTAQRAAPPSALAKSEPRAAAAMESAAPASPSGRGTRLRAAAAAGRIADLTALLAGGAPIDERDDDGETALMKAVQANHPAAAALLRRQGADLDLKNDAGASARDMAASKADPELDRALGLAP